MRVPALLAAAAVLPIPTMVVTKAGPDASTVRPKATTVRAGGKRCAVPAGTPLAALLATRAKIHVRDFGACSKRERDAGALFVDSVAGERNRGQDGWVYKVGTKVGTAGAADPTGPFGHGRLRKAPALVWFYCRLDPKEKSCQRTLATKSSVSGGVATVTVSAFNDRGEGVPAAGATVHVGAATTSADANGVALVAAAGGTVSAEAPGLVPSFPERLP